MEATEFRSQDFAPLDPKRGAQLLEVQIMSLCSSEEYTIESPFNAGLIATRNPEPRRKHQSVLAKVHQHRRLSHEVPTSLSWLWCSPYTSTFKRLKMTRARCRRVCLAVCLVCKPFRWAGEAAQGNPPTPLQADNTSMTTNESSAAIGSFSTHSLSNSTMVR